mmetsp:Transcript_70963/g.118660  ORF Transcript_70963/g.118660 Transcript_70963/m.118660 type:complete len:181 (+) Transcript_70963:908-1450(+)
MALMHRMSSGNYVLKRGIAAGIVPKWRRGCRHVFHGPGCAHSVQLPFLDMSMPPLGVQVSLLINPEPDVSLIAVPESSELPDDPVAVSVTVNLLKLDPLWLPTLILRKRIELTSVLHPLPIHNGVADVPDDSHAAEDDTSDRIGCRPHCSHAASMCAGSSDHRRLLFRCCSLPPLAKASA